MIRLSSVSKAFSGVPALTEITLSVDAGELLLLTGPSGAGKTTLLRTLVAAEHPDRGTVEIAGRDIGKLRASALPALRRNFGVIFQDLKLLRRATALENLSLLLEIHGIPPAELQARALATLTALGLERLARNPVGTLSGGEQQRVAIARALVTEPAILLADEPTGNLDASWACKVHQLLNEASRRGSTVVIATHDPAFIEQADYTQHAELTEGRLHQLRRRRRDPAPGPDPSPAKPAERLTEGTTATTATTEAS